MTKESKTQESDATELDKVRKLSDQDVSVPAVKAHDAPDDAPIKTVSMNESDAAKVIKLRSMLKRGVPWAAVEAHAVRDGIEPALVQSDAMPVIDDEGADCSTANDKHDLFRCVINDKGNRQVEFMANLTGNTKGTHIATLARRTVQTVQSRGSNLSAGSLLTVELQTLFNALGAFRGVQYARDEYNGVNHTNHAYTMQEIRAKRKPFLEHLRNLGLRTPTDGSRADIEGLDELIALIEQKNGNKIQAARDTIKSGMYGFECLAELYKPGESVIAKNVFSSGVDLCCKVMWCRYEEGKTLFGITRIFKVSFEFVVAVGGHFTTCEFVEQMENFDDHKRADISSLPYIPLHTMEDETQTRLQERFRQRGEMYSKCATGAHFLGYTQGSFYSKTGGKSQQQALRTHGRIMVDTQGSYDAGHSISTGYDPIVLAIKYKYKEYMLQMRQQQQKSSDATSASAHDNMILFDTVPQEYLTMTWPAAVGFSFTSKTWGDVLVDGLEEIKFEQASFDQLVLPPARKRILKALVRHSSDSFTDIISGKGEGSVFLLYGPPGVGKTLTAEAISEMLQRPLYSVSLGQLGTTPSELETKLGEILDLCGKWDALILLDEADIFLEKRSNNSSLERNAMVSVMLRLVEYFKGVLFLTSNRVDSLDPAFKTRITLALRYEQLDKAGRNQVWTNLLDASGQGDAVKNGLIDTMALAEQQLNGREIKNAIRLAMALAKEDDKPLAQDIIMETVDILIDFNEKMLNNADAY